MHSDAAVEPPPRGSVAAGARARPALARRYPFATTGVVVLGVLIWHWLVVSGAVNPILLASPADVSSALRELVTTGSFWTHVATTAQEMAIGWTLGVTLALVTALSTIRWQAVREALYPYIVVFSAMPKVVLLPLIAAWVGIGRPSTIGLTLLATFFPTYLNSFVGLSEVSEDSLALMRSLGARPRQVFRMLLIPGALPLIFTGLKASMTIAALGAVIGEFYGAREGLGFLINSYAYSLQTDFVYAVIVALSALAVLLYFAVELAQRLVIRWPAGSS